MLVISLCPLSCYCFIFKSSELLSLFCCREENTEDSEFGFSCDLAVMRFPLSEPQAGVRVQVAPVCGVCSLQTELASFLSLFAA